ncbi:MAG: hypothetical protein ACFFAS_18280 [Promethearchaeota archaeon]
MSFLLQLSTVEIENLKFILKAIGVVLLILILAYILLTSRRE